MEKRGKGVQEPPRLVVDPRGKQIPLCGIEKIEKERDNKEHRANIVSLLTDIND